MMEDFAEQILTAERPVVVKLLSVSPNQPRLNLIISSLPCLERSRNVVHSVRLDLITYVEFDPFLCLGQNDRSRYIELLPWIIQSRADANAETSLQNLADVRTGSSDRGSTIRIEIGPRLNFKTSFCTNAFSITSALGLNAVRRIERSKQYELELSGTVALDLQAALRQEFLDHFMDPVLECQYTSPITSFKVDLPRQPPFEIDVMTLGKSALLQANRDMSLGFDEEDLEYYSNLFTRILKRNPTNVECLDLAQSNSEHSRHWFFNGKFTVDGEPKPRSLFRMVKDTQRHSNPNNIIKFCDNSSGIEGYDLSFLRPGDPTVPGGFVERNGRRHIIFTAETHNFPTAVEPFSGATTGTGGRIRDVHATGRGAHVIAGTAGYSFGNCHIPGFLMPWEDITAEYPRSFAHPLKVIIEASNGASDYGNKFGEPVICGFARSFGARLPTGERREWVKPIMFSGGIGSIDDQWTKKLTPDQGMSVVKIGGPVYRIGLGGGAASSTVVQGSNNADVDFNAVQRGDAEMEQKLNRVIRGCIELDDNPIVSIHDQGAGGNANVLKEIVEPAGAVIRADSFSLGDETLSIHELWVAEYQESVAVLIPSEKLPVLHKIAERERCPVDVVGEITGSGKIVLEDFSGMSRGSTKPVDLQLDLVLGNIPLKNYNLERAPEILLGDTGGRQNPVAKLPKPSIADSVEKVLRLPSVASKRYLTNKVDRSVTGLIAQQQCVGPFHTPLADVAVIALSPFDTVGSATAIGEQPIKMLFDVKRGARLSVVEALTNLMFAKVSSLKDVKCSGNWMWPAKLPGEGAALYDACEAMCGVMEELGIAVDGGKDSLSMAAKCGDEIVKAPGTLVISAYAPCPDIRKKVTPDLRVPDGEGALLWVDLSGGQKRLQGSAYAQVHADFTTYADVPDLESSRQFISAFEVSQRLINDGLLTAGHDISDGGLIVTLLEMAIAGNAVFNVRIPVDSQLEGQPEAVLFAEEVGWVLEVRPADQQFVCDSFGQAGVSCHFLGVSKKVIQDVQSLKGQTVYAPFVYLNDRLVYGSDAPGIAHIRSIWEDFSHHIECIQSDPVCAESQRSWLALAGEPNYRVSFEPEWNPTDIRCFLTGGKPLHRVGVVREEGSNGDREMAAALYLAGFEVWDVTVQDMLQQRVDLNFFRGLVFVGGFSYADVFGSAKGWAAVLAFNTTTRAQLEQFFQRPDTFSLGVCNGCQLMALLGVIGDTGPNAGKIDLENRKVTLQHNKSGRFESRFSTVRIGKTIAVMLKGMGGSRMPVWVAHGEGCVDSKNLDEQRLHGCIAMEYIDSHDQRTESYPENPNGSPEGVAGICSPDGRHLAIMPHPERTVLTWQWSWIPAAFNWPKDALLSPWMKLFRNAYEWCDA